MKNLIRKSAVALLFTGSLAIGTTAHAQAPENRTVTTTTESTGTISEFGPEGIVIRTTTDSNPVRYSSEKTTTYVDENGRAVSVTTVKSGLPVTVFYTKVGDRLVATKVIVRKAVVVEPKVVEPQVIEKKKTTTTTTEEVDE